MRVSEKNLVIIKDELVRFKHLICKSMYPDAKVYLFGSWAKGLAHEWSDIDVCVISTKIKSSYDDGIVLRQMASDIDEDIAPIAMKSSDFNDKYLTLATEVKKHGILI